MAKKMLVELPDCSVWTADFDGMLDEPGKPPVLQMLAQVSTREGALEAARALEESCCLLPSRQP